MEIPLDGVLLHNISYFRHYLSPASFGELLTMILYYCSLNNASAFQQKHRMVEKKGIIFVEISKERKLAMSKEVSFKNRDRFIQLGVAISTLRKLRGMSQEKLAEKAGISRSLVSCIEAPGLANGFSLEVFFDIADALEIDPADLIGASVFPDQMINKKK